MNEIQSLDENFENMMEIKEILFQDGEPVEFGQPLVMLGD